MLQYYFFLLLFSSLISFCCNSFSFSILIKCKVNSSTFFNSTIFIILFLVSCFSFSVIVWTLIIVIGRIIGIVNHFTFKFSISLVSNIKILIQNHPGQISSIVVQTSFKTTSSFFFSIHWFLSVATHSLFQFLSNARSTPPPSSATAYSSHSN